MTVELELLNDAPEFMPDMDDAYGDSAILDASGRPAAAMIWGLSGMFEELAKLLFLECCMPWTMLVCR